MTENEKLIDRIGQITFRIETNVFVLSNYISQNKNCKSLMTSFYADASITALFSDVEKLKQLKLDIEKSFENS